jgi:hypothetical protein
MANDAANRHRTTNEEFVADLMAFSKFGALTQVFILEALRFYADVISKTDGKDNPSAMVNPAIWRAIAEEVKSRIDNRYEAQREGQ